MYLHFDSRVIDGWIEWRRRPTPADNRVISEKWQQKTPDFREGKLARQEQPLLYWITWNDNADAMLYLPGGGAMLFLTDVDHVSFEKANETRQNNLQSATVSLQVVIGLCKRKETAALISQNRRQSK